MDKRKGDVTNAGASIVYYEKWRQTGDDDLLRKIRDYNEDDCRSTYMLREWLLSLKPHATSMAERTPPQEAKAEKSDKIREHEARLGAYERRLLNGLPEDSSEWTGEQHLRVLMFQLLDFHRRAAKPAWWALFARRDMNEDELADDAECIAGLRLLSSVLSASGRGTTIATYEYPEQDFKLRDGDACVRTDTTQTLGTIDAIDEDRRTVTIKIGKGKEVPLAVSISSGGPIDTAPIKEALFRLADGLLDEDGSFSAALSFLRKAAPRIHGHEHSQPIIDETLNALPQIINAVVNLDQSTLFIQGPPGAGKTYTGSHVITELLARGYRVGVTSNSHKAIHNLLHAVEKEATKRGLRFGGAYKASAQTRGSDYEGQQIQTVQSNDEIIDALDEPYFQLFAGTAWLFSKEAFEERLDYLLSMKQARWLPPIWLLWPPVRKTSSCLAIRCNWGNRSKVCTQGNQGSLLLTSCFKDVPRSRPTVGYSLPQHGACTQMSADSYPMQCMRVAYIQKPRTPSSRLS